MNQPHLEDTLAVREAVFDTLRYHAALEVDIPQPCVDLHRIDIPQRMAQQLVAEWRVAGKVLADRKVIAEYPASLWDHIKSALGLKHEVKQVLLTEHVAFPQLALPKNLNPMVRVRWVVNLEVKA